MNDNEVAQSLASIDAHEIEQATQQALVRMDFALDSVRSTIAQLNRDYSQLYEARIKFAKVYGEARRTVVEHERATGNTPSQDGPRYTGTHVPALLVELGLCSGTNAARRNIDIGSVLVDGRQLQPREYDLEALPRTIKLGRRPEVDLTGYGKKPG